MKLLLVRILLVLLLAALIPLWVLTAVLALLVTALGEDESVRVVAKGILKEAREFVRHWLALFKAPLDDEDEINGV